MAVRGEMPEGIGCYCGDEVMRCRRKVKATDVLENKLVVSGVLKHSLPL